MIEFREDTHQYFLDGRELVSVTRLMRKHGLAPDYTAVRSDVLEKKAERGTFIHKEIEDYNKTGAVGFSTELAQYIDHIKKNALDVIGSELIANNDVCAGTVDLLLSDCHVVTIADIKTTATLHKDAVSWQLSIYNALLGYKADRAQAFHFDADGNLKVVDVPFKPREEVERLFDCERAGVLYEQRAIATPTQLALIAEAEQIIERAEREKKAAEATAAVVKVAILEAMEKNGVKSFESDNIKITYVAPIARTTLDTIRLKKEQPEIAEKYSKTSETKASLRITLKGAEK